MYSGAGMFFYCLQGRILVTFAANRVISFIAADLDLFAAVDGLTVLNPQRHCGFSFAEPANGLHLFNFIGVDQHVFAALEKIILEIIFQAEGHDRNIQFIYDPHKLEDAVLAEELAFINQHAVGLWQISAYNAVNICIIVDRYGLLTKSDAGGNIPDLVPIVQGWSENEHRLALLLVIMGYLENLNGFTAVHCPILEKQLCHVHLSFRSIT